MLRHRLRPHLHQFPDDIQDLARPSKCIRVHGPPVVDGDHHETLLHDMRHERRREMQSASSTYPIGVPPPPPQSRHEPQAPPMTQTTWMSLPENTMVETPSESPNTQRRRLMEEQDMAYYQSMVDDNATLLTTPESTAHGIDETDAANDIEQDGAKTDALDETVFQPVNVEDRVTVMVVTAEGRHQRPCSLAQTRICHLMTWLRSQGCSVAEMFTNFPRQKWPADTFLSTMPVSRSHIVMYAE